MDDIMKESHGSLRNVKRYLFYLFPTLVVVVVLKGLFFIKEQLSREVYYLCVLLVLLVLGLGFLIISKHKMTIKENPEKDC